MPTFHLKMKSGSDSSGHYDYVIRDKEKYPDKDDFVYSESKNFEKLDCTPEEYWKTCMDKSVVAEDFIAYKEFELSLLNGLSTEENLEALQEFCELSLGDKHVYTIGVHAPEYDDPEMKGNNLHAHIMFSQKIIDHDNLMPMEQFLKPYNYRDKDRPKELRTGGAAIDRTMSSHQPTYDKESQEWLDSFCNSSRKLWDKIANAAIDKHNEKAKLNGGELLDNITHKSFATRKAEALKQADEALASGDMELAAEYLKVAELNDRRAINKEYRLYQQSKDILSESDIKKLDENEYNKEIKQQKIKEFQEPTKPLTAEQIKERLGEFSSKIKDVKKKPTPKAIEDQVINILSKKEYFYLRDGLKRQKKKKQQDLVKEAEIELAIKDLRNKWINTNAFKDKKNEVETNYNKKIKKAVDKLRDEIKQWNSILKKTLELEKSKDIDVVKSVVVEDVNDPAKDNIENAIIDTEEMLNELDNLKDWEVEDDIYADMCFEFKEQGIKSNSYQKDIDNMKYDVADIVQERFIEKFKGTKHERKIPDYVSNVCYDRPFTVSIILGDIEKLI